MTSRDRHLRSLSKHRSPSKFYAYNCVSVIVCVRDGDVAAPGESI